MMKPKRWRIRRRSGLNATKGTIRATMGSSRGDCVDTRNNYWSPTMSQRWIIQFPTLLPMGGWTLKMTSIHSIGCRARSVYLHFCLNWKYRICWFYTCKVRNGIGVPGLLSWKNHGLFLILRWFSLFFTLINCMVVVTSWRRWRSNYPRNSTMWRRSTRSMERTSSTPRITRLDRYR